MISLVSSLLPLVASQPDPVGETFVAAPEYQWWIEHQMMMMVFGDDNPGAVDPFELGEF